jgi:sporulation protein YlmC with PRC-barrel domain
VTSSDYVSVVIPGSGPTCASARWRPAHPPSGAERFVLDTRRGSGAEPDDREADWLVEVEVDLRGSNLDPEYWLSNCHGFLVDSELGRDIGVVNDIHLEPSSGRAVALVVASGWFGRRLRTIPVSDVLRIIPSEERLVVRDPERLDDALSGGG